MYFFFFYYIWHDLQSAGSHAIRYLSLRESPLLVLVVCVFAGAGRKSPYITIVGWRWCKRHRSLEEEENGSPCSSDSVAWQKLPTSGRPWSVEQEVGRHHGPNDRLTPWRTALWPGMGGSGLGISEGEGQRSEAGGSVYGGGWLVTAHRAWTHSVCRPPHRNRNLLPKWDLLQIHERQTAVKQRWGKDVCRALLRPS